MAKEMKGKSGKKAGSEPTGPAPYWDGSQWVLPQQEPVKPTPPPTGPTPYWDGAKWVLPLPGQELEPEAAPEPEPEVTASPSPAAVAAPVVPEPEREVVYVQAKRKGVKGLVAILVLQCVILLAGLTALALVLFNIQLPIPELGAIGGAAPQEVRLQAAASVGTVPFLDTPFAATIDEDVAQPALAPAPEDGVTLTVQPVVADAPFLYGVDDTAAAQWCDRDGLGEALAAHPNKVAVWAEALSSDDTLDLGGDALTAGAIAASIANLGRVVLTRDTRVTLHGLTSGGIEPVQAVLQKGSWVLVDRSGLPRVTCNGANPLTAPQVIEGSALFTGAAWPDLDPAELVEVVPAPYQLPSFTVRVPASEDGVPSYQNTPWPKLDETTPVGDFSCLEPVNENQGGGPVTSLTLTNEGAAPVVLFGIDVRRDGKCVLTSIAAISPENAIRYPLGTDDTKWVPWVNQGFLATDLDGNVMWSQHVTQVDKGTDAAWTIS